MKAWLFAGLVSISPSVALSQTVTEIMVAQMKLNSLGFDVGEADGRNGPATRRGLDQAGEKYGFKPTVSDLISHFAVATISGSTPLTDLAIEEAIRESLSDKLKDPFSAKYKDLRHLPSRRICGLVNAKNSYGAYAGWVSFITVSEPSKIGEKYSALVFLGDGGGFVEALCLIDAGP